MIIAIDGPAASGKSTLARSLARTLGLPFLDTGAMYRAVTLEVLARGVDPQDAEACAGVAETVRLGFDEEGRILIDGQPGEPGIRGPEVTARVSEVAAHSAVRRALVPLQRGVAEERGAVAEGRDMATVVFPDADHKFFLIASAGERARRRAAQEGRPEEVASIEAEIERRDEYDSSRVDSPLRQAEDACVVDTDGLDAGGVLEAVLARVRAPAVEPRQRPGEDGEQGLEPPLTTRGIVYWLCCKVTRVVYWPFYRPRILDVDRIPAEGRVVIVSNHQSFIDIPLVAQAIHHRHVAFMARSTLARAPGLGFIMKRCGAILIRRGGADRAALRRAADHLEAEDAVLIFAEGTRSQTGRLGRFRKGALFVARMGSAPIIPCGIRGSYNAWPPGARLPRPGRLEIRFGSPVDSRLPDALERVRREVARLVGEDPGVQEDLLDLPPERDEPYPARR